MKDARAGTRFDGRDNPNDEIVMLGGPCYCGAPEGLAHLHDRIGDEILPYKDDK